jgi:RNA-directed DNA polymerase
VVDIDLEKFFDRVNHDLLMGLVAKRVADQRVRRLIRGYLTAGVLADGLVGPTDEGTPQGGPLSPLLSNSMLDVLEKELERRGHCFVRYADDCNIYVQSQRAGERVIAGATQFLTRRLKLKVTARRARSRAPVRANSSASASPARRRRAVASRRRRWPGSPAGSGR